ncbi:hypothetical protein CCH79_00014341 [Gambusia affinis]|uniref:Uncharacterized protein n=1 Tax=Gambusia affinis TaxID=33528 RepID=A0A315V6Y2_GAMAF|nr:hypothetical protein CCH79_00014341 [Gambusia affinis]
MEKPCFNDFLKAELHKEQELFKETLAQCQGPLRDEKFGGFMALIDCNIFLNLCPNYVQGFNKRFHLSLFYILQMNMLLRLQEAANYSSTQSCDSDSTSHHDDQLDSSLESAL